LDQAGIIRERYASQPAYEQSLDKAEQDKASTRTKFPQGSPWTSSSVFEARTAQPDTDIDMPGLQDISDEEDRPLETPITADPKEANPKSSDDINGPKTHKEPPGFNGDRVLSNAILFLMEFGWWVELNYDTSVHDICAKEVECCNFAPGLVAQMLRVDANHIPGLALADFVHQIAAGLARSCNSFMTVCESGDP
jgi:hypothetical protein